MMPHLKRCVTHNQQAMISLEGLPNWRVEVKELSAGVYKATAVHASGPKIELTGTDEKKLIAEIETSAKLMALEIAKKTSQQHPR